MTPSNLYLSLFALLCIPFNACEAQELSAKKLLCWPAVEPTPQFLLQNLERTNELPFDGYVLRIVDNQGKQLMWEMWGDKSFKLADFSQAQSQLKELQQKYPGEIFLRMNVTPGNIDWLDDEAWQHILDNTKIMAELARAGACTGFMFDTEQYVNQPFNYEMQPQKQQYSQAQFARLIQKRGSSLMEIIQSAVNSPKIIFSFGYYAAQAHTGDGRKGVNYELLAPFLDGMLSSANPQTQLIDGWEFSYDYKTEQEFISAKEKLNEAFHKVSTLIQHDRKLPAKYAQSFGIWIDYQHKQPPWNTADFKQNHYSPAELKQALTLGQKHSAGYIWIYSQQPNWFTKQDLPPEYQQAIRESRK